jgi:hypothetical protein
MRHVPQTNKRLDFIGPVSETNGEFLGAREIPLGGVQVPLVFDVISRRDQSPAPVDRLVGARRDQGAFEVSSRLSNPSSG